MSVSLSTRFHQPRSLWLTFGVLHLLILILLLPLIVSGQVLSDISFYRLWAFDGINLGIWRGISVEWVYPVGTMLPILLAALFGSYLYQLAWLLLFTGLNLIAVLVLTRAKNNQGYFAAYWWLGATAILGTVAVGRIDGLTAPMVIVGLLLLNARPYLASAVLSAATWIKVWPAAVLFAIVVASKQRFKAIIAGIAVTAVVVAIVLAGGGAKYLLGFLGAQGDRGMQLEAPFTTPGLWQAIFNQNGTYVFEDKIINTREVRGGMSDVVGAVMNPLLAISAIVVVILLLWALRRGAPAQQLILAGSLSLVCAFIVFNKVGSPQFQLWLAAIVAVGLYYGKKEWRFPGFLMLAIAVLTTLVYPIFYVQLYELNPWIAIILSLRNVALFVLFGWAIREVITLARRGGVRAVKAAK
ncbi:glycosyltransferase 87 family protein [Renibacterium salmoninarum]|uniref:glycosyltransferase 87 family protein n=1 Tax=Renibacterium salmoninarum TaxID=1646 RepID=UPI0002E626C6|nr:glycosyltransferase 87 family protein [Renibacterium salmoninarum]